MAGSLPRVLRHYGFSFLLLLALLGGFLTGGLLGPDAVALKPLGELFLNLLFTIVVPLVFFSLASAVAGMADLRRLGRILGRMGVVFLATGLIAALLMLLGVLLFPPGEGVTIPLGEAPALAEGGNLLERIVRMVSVEDFSLLLSRRQMPALVLVSLLVGLATAACGEKGRSFRAFLESGAAVMLKLVRFLMYYAPLGLFAWFAWLTGVFGPSLLGAYARTVAVYYPLAFLYFFVFLSLYAWLAARRTGVRAFWKAIPLTALTAFSTGSSLASVPANLAASKKIGVPEDIGEVVIPVGATIHMDGSALAAMVKIALLFGLFGREFAGLDVFLTAIGVSILAGTVISGIPGGGIIGEMLIIGLYGFPPEALPVISMVGALVDPPATMVNACGDTTAGMLVARSLEGRSWQAAGEGGGTG